MNITTQDTRSKKIKHINNIPFIPSTTNRLRLNDARGVLNEKMKPFEVNIFKVKNVSFNMVHCSRGAFTMGADDTENNPKRNEQIKHPFLLGETEVTQELYKAVMGYNPSNFDQNGGKNPVENVNWYEAVMFCNKLSQILRKRPYYHISDIKKKRGNKIDSANIQINENSNGFRLPTEKEWEYAAKAGTNNKYAGCDNETDLKNYGWYRVNSSQSTQPVKTLLPNEWGFYDMSGNVDEWCWDKSDLDSADRVFRGGTWKHIAWYLRSASRSAYLPNYRSEEIGFRVAAFLVN